MRGEPSRRGSCFSFSLTMIGLLNMFLNNVFNLFLLILTVCVFSFQDLLFFFLATVARVFLVFQPVFFPRVSWVLVLYPIVV